MTQMIAKAGLKIAEPLVRFIEQRALPGTGIEPAAFWSALAAIYADFEPENAALLKRRDQMQAKIDAWHEARAGQPIDQAAYQGFLHEIGYLVPSPRPSRSRPPGSMTRSPGSPARSWWRRCSTPGSS